MATKKSEIYSSLWQSCDALRGGMDASQYKDYVLVLLFIKYVSDKILRPLLLHHRPPRSRLQRHGCPQRHSRHRRLNQQENHRRPLQSHPPFRPARFQRRMAHLLESTHNKKFVALMDHYLPKWKHHRAKLNHLPLRHENWG